MVILIRGDKMNKKAAILLLKGYEFIVEKEVYDLALGFNIPYSYIMQNSL